MILTGRIGSYPVILDLNDQIQCEVYFGIYEAGITPILQTLLQPGGVFYDVGANIGYFSFLASEIVGATGQVHAFEPVPANLDRFRLNLIRSNISNVVVNDVAVVDHPGRVTLFLPVTRANSGLGSIVSAEERPVPLTVSSISLDDYVFSSGNRFPNVVKLDIEAGEPEALQGMYGILSAKEAPDLVVEVNPVRLGERGLSPAAILSHINDARYLMYQQVGRGLEPVDSSEFVSFTNIIATKYPERLACMLVKPSSKRPS